MTRRRLLTAFVALGVTGFVWLGSAQLRPAHGLGNAPITMVQRVAEALPHTHRVQKTGETTGKIGYIDGTNKIIIAQLKDGAVIKALTAVPTERLRVGERVKVAYGVGEHGEQVFTVTGPARWSWAAVFGG